VAGVAEFPQERHFVASNSADELVDRAVWRSVNIENATATFLGGVEHGDGADLLREARSQAGVELK
jgi:hypothetical protein